MKKIYYIMIGLMTVIYALILTSCEDGTKDIGLNTGKLSVKITDAPMDYGQFKEVAITIDKIELRKVNSDNTKEIVLLSDEPFTTNMLNLVNGITKTMLETEIPVGNYDLIRLYFSASSMTLMSGQNYSNNMDYHNNDSDDHNWSGNDNWSGGMMGGNMMGGNMMNGDMMMNGGNGSMDIPINFKVEDGMNETILFDLDINRSFQCNDVDYGNWNSGDWMKMSGYSFYPVMRMVKMSETGTIMGSIKNADTNSTLENVNVYLMNGGKIYTTTHSDAKGNYKFIGIPKGSYTVEAELNGYQFNKNEDHSDVQVQVGNNTSVNCTMTAQHD